MKKIITAVTATILISSTALAMEAHHQGHNMHQMHATESDSPSTQAFMADNAKMHKAMDITYTGDADIDFLRGMIAHHQGAVDMAQTVLKYGGNDHRVNRMAREIIRAQELEISWMTKWLNQLEEKRDGYQDKAWEGDYLDR